MPPLEDPEIRAKYLHALSLWRVQGYVRWKPGLETALAALLPGHSQKAVAEEMWKHADGGGRIFQVPETRDPWAEHFDFHIDLWPTISGEKLYVETVFPYWEEDPSILIVSIHEP